MKWLIVRVLIFSWILALSVISHAATNDNIRMNWDRDPSSGTSSNPFQAGSQDPTSHLSDEALLRLLENRRDQKKQDGLAGEGRDEITNTGKQKNDSRTVATKKPQVLVKVEPGDGLVKLSWKLANLPVKSGSQPLRFSILYGIESEKLNRTLHVGSNDGYVLRELKNNQPYYVQIVASDR